MQPTYCPKCKAELKPNAKFCGKCGERIQIPSAVNNSRPQEPATPPAQQPKALVLSSRSTGQYDNMFLGVIAVVVVVLVIWAIGSSRHPNTAVGSTLPPSNGSTAIQAGGQAPAASVGPMTQEMVDYYIGWEGNGTVCENLLRKYPSIINATDKDGYTALIYAAKLLHLPRVQYLISKGADVNIRNKSNHSALWCARNTTEFPEDAYIKSLKTITAEILKSAGAIE